MKRSGSTTVRMLNEISQKIPEADQIRLGRALSAPEAEQLVRAVAIACLAGDIAQVRDDLNANLAAVLILIGDMKPDIAKSCAKTIVSVLIENNVEAIEELNSGSSRLLSAAADRAAAERQIGYLSTVAKRTRIFMRHTPEDLRGFLDFADRYRTQVNRDNSELIPAYFDTEKRVSIEHLHVAPSFDSQHGVVTFDSLFNRALPEYERVIVLGDPGAGKSTFAQRVVYEHSRRSLGERDARVPFVVRIRDYEKQRDAGGSSIPDHLSQWVRKQYHLEVPVGAVEYFLATGLAFVVFDGLDELQEVSQRRDMVTAIESFIGLYPTTAVLATSRLVGYREAPLRKKTFQELQIRRFSFKDIETYVHRWFSLDGALAEYEKGAVADSFLGESYSIDDVRANPMMLSLLCNVYRGARSIPRNRAELYQRCAQMLFERWDAQRGIRHGGILKADARGALQDVALWTFGDRHSSDYILERDLRKRLVDYWMVNRVEDRLQAEDEADRLMESWRGRAWVLTDVGIVESQGDEQRAYQFTHQTFLEYFAAVELVRRHPSPMQLWGVLESRLLVSEWDIVAQVAIQLLEDGYRGGKDGFIDCLLDLVEDSSTPLAHRVNLLEFAVRNLDILAPSPTVQRRTARVAVELVSLAQPTFSDATEFGDDSGGSEPADLDDQESAAAIAVLQAGLRDSGSYFPEEASLHFGSTIRSESKMKAAKAFVVGANLDLLDLATCDESGMADVVVAARQGNLVRERWSAWADVTYFAATTALRHGLVSHIEFARASPTAAILLDEPPIARSSGLYPGPSPGLHWFRRYLGVPDTDSDFAVQVSYGGQARDVVSALGQRLLKSDVPYFGVEWFQTHGIFRTLATSPPESQADEARMNRDPFEIFGASVLLCAFLEEAVEPGDATAFNKFALLQLGPLEPLRLVFHSRFVPELRASAQKILLASPLPKLAQRRLAEWSDESVDFVA